MDLFKQGAVFVAGACASAGPSRVRAPGTNLCTFCASAACKPRSSPKFLRSRCPGAKGSSEVLQRTTGLGSGCF
jgi:hypothetical protein